MLQETALTLALLYSTKFKGNYYYENSNVRDLALAQIAYWQRIQNKNGSFDEFFPNEQSFSATAFTLYSSCKALQILNEDPEFIRNTAEKSCQFLLSYGDPGASNQISASIAAINLYSILFNDISFDEQLNQQLNKLLESQSDEGWTPEYGGYDVGYQSITLAYLSDYNTTRNNKKVSESIQKMIQFLSYFVHPDGSVGGEYGSRSTNFFVPLGFVQNFENCKPAASIFKKIFFTDIGKINNSIDDRYICHFILPSYLLSINDLDLNNHEVFNLPYEQNFKKFFKETGLYIFSNQNYYFISNFNKGGVYNIHGKKKQNNYRDAGYLIKTNKKLYLTNWLNSSSTYKLDEAKNSVEISTGLFQVSSKTPSSFYHMLLRFISFFGGKRILPVLKKYFINKEKISEEMLKRNFVFEDDQVKITDRIKLKNSTLEDIHIANPCSTFRYVAPSNYFHQDELNFIFDHKANFDIIENKVVFRQVFNKF